MADKPAVTSATWWIGAIVVSAIVAGIVALTGIDRSGERGSGLPEAFDYQIEKYKQIDPALIRYHQTAEIPCRMQQARGVAAGPEDRIYVAGDRAIHVFTAEGTLHRQIALNDPPRCLAVGGASHAFPGRLYVGMDHHVEVIDADGRPVERWESLGEKSLVTSVAVAENDVFVADAGGATVVRYDTSGRLIGRIGPGEGGRGFAIPSPFFDVAVGPDGLLRVVNPGALRIEAYTFDGNLELFWGEHGAAIEGFFGCCNPAHFAILPDGRFVTAEKGLLRVKVYTPGGRFECVVAGPEQLDSPAGTAREGRFDAEFKAVDVAADSRGRVLILDYATGKVRIFEFQESNTEAE